MLLENTTEKNVFMNELTSLFNRMNIDTEMNVPDNALAQYVYTALENLRQTSIAIDNYYGIRKLNGEVIKSNVK